MALDDRVESALAGAWVVWVVVWLEVVIAGYLWFCDPVSVRHVAGVCGY
jgi:hypothetical protein